jgi:hypothetical protein
VTPVGERLREDAALWTVGEVSTGELVLCACDALVDGLDSEALRTLAGANEATSAFDIDDLLRSVAHDFGFEYSPHGTEPARLAAACVFASRCTRGELMPRELARWMHERIGHGHTDPRVEDLVSLNDQYNILEYTGQSAADIDAAVTEAARRLLDSMTPAEPRPVGMG